MTGLAGDAHTTKVNRTASMQLSPITHLRRKGVIVICVGRCVHGWRLALGSVRSEIYHVCAS